MNIKIRVKILSLLSVGLLVFTEATNCSFVCAMKKASGGDVPHYKLHSKGLHIELPFSAPVIKPCERNFSGLSSEEYTDTPKIIKGMSDVQLHEFWLSLINSNNLELMDNFCSFLNEKEYGRFVNVGALDYAISHGSWKALQYLIDHDVDPNGADANGITPLMRAVVMYIKSDHNRKYLYQQMILALLSHGALINKADNNGNTALHHVAMLGGKQELYDFLVNMGANEDLDNASLQSPKAIQAENMLRREMVAVKLA